jgi:CMP-N-acetylneuraminic acid synthetase
MIALLPMKGDSERIPNKNMKILNNKRLFYYIADNLKESYLFDSLVINTDSDEISNFAKERYGNWVKIIERPVHLLGDYISMNAIIEYDVSFLGEDQDYFQTHSTNPFLKTETIKKAINVYTKGVQNGKLDSLFSVNSINARLYDHNIIPINHDLSKLERTQDLEVVYLENSNFYIFSGKSFSSKTHRIGEKPLPYIMSLSSLESLDIDTYDEWLFAEKILKNSTL